MLSETKLKVLKEISSGFSRDEAIWASGYLAGLAGTSAAVADLPPQQTTHTTAVKKITLVYGTETGNSKKLATELAGVAKKKGIQVKLGDLSQYKPKDLAKEEYFFVVISTQGEGEPPILAKKFYEYIHENELNLSNIKFGVLALGDSTYPQFCKTGEDVDTRFEVLGAERIIPLKRCDIDYKLPETAKDVIMIGPGTGIAPFRSFLWERDATGAEGRNWLFFGDRSFVSDFLYQSEFQDFLKTGALTNLDLAFSRDTAEKVYVQHRLQQKSSEVFQWLEGGASVYVCGAKEPMSKDVEETLLGIIQHEGKRNEEEAKNYLEELELSGRYAKDVY
ncbi:hypothetical protein BEI02_15035 [Elizabethkingia sp. HvH-WGS333]|uniref:flavodoxin domain-containing protein n=1 Tax=Elizabethkingia sp. HvH-WGS333 TaxID=1883430 RepID=UPI0008F85FF7|nr:flavodoxin domain-containing protein [Elizabethkingia sp. HvH-WGS333]OIK46446.1 hypothetical protein BEI02_15035 [Elizabethkingia sp. HvH-WGS333]